MWFTILCFATTGARREEVAGIQVSDLDWRKNLIRLVGKGNKVRWVHFHKEARRAVLAYLAVRKSDLPQLWLSDERRPLTVDGVSQAMGAIRQRAGVRYKDVMHIFRRTWAAESSRQQVPTQFILGQAGWESPAMLDRYTRALRDEEDASTAYTSFKPFSR